MSRIIWGEHIKRPYTIGIDRGMFYIPDEAGIPWNGLLEVVTIRVCSNRSVSLNSK